MSVQPTLFETVGAVALWLRPTPRARWRLVGTADTGPEALALMDRSGVNGGDWMLIDDGRDPNTVPAGASATIE